MYHKDVVSEMRVEGVDVKGSDLGLRKIQDGRLQPRIGSDGSWNTARWKYCLAWNLVFMVYIWRTIARCIRNGVGNSRGLRQGRRIRPVNIRREF